MQVFKTAHPDLSQFDPKKCVLRSEVEARRAALAQCDVKLVEKTPHSGAAELRKQPSLKDMVTLQRGNRLSITPVTPRQWSTIVKLAAGKAPPA